MNIIPKAFWTAAAVAMLLTFANAQMGPGRRNYDPKTEITVRGTIQDVQQYTGRRGWNGTHLMLKTADGVLDVHLGPSNYISQKDFSFAKGDEVEVTGSKFKMGSTDAVLAREVVKDGKHLVLRDSQGIPYWAGGRGQS